MANQIDVAEKVSDEASTALGNTADPGRITAVIGARVFDVGQGDCIGLRNENDVIFCYIDYGGLNDHPDKSNPAYTSTRLPVRVGSCYVPIVLTHWDIDHFWSAAKKNPDAQRCAWIVPRQHVGPTAARFAAKLRHARCWPESIGQTRLTIDIGSDYRFEARKCGAFDKTAVNEDRNLTGLVVTILYRSSADWDQMILLPGDCSFDRIPDVSDIPICGLVAYHHGSRKDWRSATGNAISNRFTRYEMVYSVGRNHYGHPRRDNYVPDWDRQAVETRDIRNQTREFHDLDWK